jgi:hypothetical protein
VIGLPLLIVCLTVVALVVFVGAYNDASVRWTVAAAVITGGALVLAAVGLPFAIWQLVLVQRDQKRIAEELAGPRLDVGFPVGDDYERVLNEGTVPVAWPDGEDASRWATVEIRAINVGTRSARNINLTIVLPPNLVDVAIVDNDWLNRDADGHWRVVAREEILNPGVRRELRWMVALPRGLGAFDVMVNIASEDAPFRSKTLRAHVQLANIGQRTAVGASEANEQDAV